MGAADKPPPVVVKGAPLRRQQLDQARCRGEGCDHGTHDGPLELFPLCHPGGPLRVVYLRDGLLSIRCHACDGPVCLVAVAEEN